MHTALPGVESNSVGYQEVKTMFLARRNCSILLLAAFVAISAPAQSSKTTDKGLARSSDKKRNYDEDVRNSVNRAFKQLHEDSQKFEIQLTSKVPLKSPAVRDSVMAIAADVRQLQELILTANTPIKIGGGSMTIRFPVRGNSTGDPGTIPLCANVDTTKASFRDHNDNLLKLTISAPGSTPGVWEMELYGRTADGNSASSRGIRLVAKMTACDGSTGSSVDMSTFDGDNDTPVPSFYPTDGMVDVDSATYKHRFRDPDAVNCSGPNVPPGTSPTSGEEDICERMFQVDVHDKPGGSLLDTRECKHGECVVFIGK